MKHFTVLVACVVLVAPVADAQTQASGNQGKTWQDIKTLPDFSGVWEPINPVLQKDAYAQKLPLNPDGAKTYADLAKLAAAKRHIATRTDMEKGRAIPCQTRGFPGAMLDSATLIDFAFTPGRVTVTDTSGWARRILTDGRAHLNLVDQFQGDSIGHWEGQTLVVDTESLDANNELFVGFYIGANAHVVERYTLTDANTLSDDITIDAPDIFKEPYKTTMKFRRHADWQINEYDCYFNNRNNDHKIIR